MESEVRPLLAAPLFPESVAKLGCAEPESCRTFLSIPPTTMPKIREFIHRGANRVEIVISRFRSPVTTVVLLPSFLRAISATASGRIGKVGVAPFGQISVLVGPGHRASTAIPSLRTSRAKPSAKCSAWALEAA